MTPAGQQQRIEGAGDGAAVARVAYLALELALAGVGRLLGVVGSLAGGDRGVRG